jgi:hypothetical protein
MKMKSAAALLLGIIVFSVAHAQTSETTQAIVPDTQSNNTFGDKEWFEFRIHYGFFNASIATLEVDKTTLNGRSVFHAKGYGKTVGLARWFFKVEDHYESYFDTVTGVPYKFIRNIDEGGYTKDIEIDFDQETKQALVYNKKKKTKTLYPFNDKAQDLISAFYYLRNFLPAKDLIPNQSFAINKFFDSENYLFKLKFMGKENLSTKFGIVPSLKFRPIVQSGRVFREQESVTLWVSDDQNRIPLRMQADLAVGSIKADLENFKNLKHPFTIEVSR